MNGFLDLRVRSVKGRVLNGEPVDLGDIETKGGNQTLEVIPLLDTLRVP